MGEERPGLLPRPLALTGLPLAASPFPLRIPMLTRIGFILGAVFLVAYLFLWWTEPRLGLVGIEGEGWYRGEMVNDGRTAVTAFLCDGPPRHVNICECREVTRAVLLPGERLAIEGYAFQELTTCGLRP